MCVSAFLFRITHTFEDTPLAGSAAILCTAGLDVIRKEAWPFYRTSSGVRLCWELEEPKGPKVRTGYHGPSADLGSVCVTEHGSDVAYLHPPQQSHPLSLLHEPLHWRAKRDPKAKMLSLQSFLRKGVSLGYVGRNYNLKDLKAYWVLEEPKGPKVQLTFADWERPKVE